MVRHLEPDDAATSMISLSLCFSSGPAKMTSIPFFAKARIWGSERPKCSATSLYSLDSGLPKTPTSSVCILSVCHQTLENVSGRKQGWILTHSTTVHSSTFPSDSSPLASRTGSYIYVYT